MTTNPSHAKASELQVDDWFIDPRGEGRRPARVVAIDGAIDGKVHFTLDDESKWGPWAASYGSNEDLERA